MKKENTVIVSLAVLAAVTAAAWLILVAPGLTGNDINMPRGVTSLSVNHYELHMAVLWACAIIGILVFSAMFVSIILHRKSRGYVAAKFSHSTTAEVVWTIIPVMILVGMAIPATTALIEMEDTAGSEMAVKITGFQWLWKYDYLDEDITIYSSLDAKSNEARQLNSGIDVRSVENYLLEVDNPLVLPVGKKIKFLITADDVIHAWWVPEFGWKRDAIPGYINEAWATIDKPGIYRGQCAELCGQGHAFMPIVVVALEQDEYDAWVSKQLAGNDELQEDAVRLWTRSELMDHGKKVYENSCSSCHQLDGKGLVPAFPALAGSGVSTGPVKDNINVVMNGQPGTAMVAFRNQLSDSDIASALTYTRNAFGNHTDDVVQPITIADIKRQSTELRTAP